MCRSAELLTLTQLQQICGVGKMYKAGLGWFGWFVQITAAIL